MRVGMLKPPSTLEELVAPLSEAEFLALLRDRKLTLLRGTRADRYTGLLNWNLLRGMLDHGLYPSDLVHLRLSRDSVNVPLDRWFSKNPTGASSKVDVAKVEAYLAEGFNLCITCIDEHAPHLTALCNDIRKRSFEQIKIGVIVTTGKFGAFKVHYDPEDLIILQVEGSKRWKIYGPAVSNPVIGMPTQEPPPEQDPIFDEVLQAGDFLFVPGGNWHRCENGPGRSLHLGFFFQPPTGWHFVKAIMSDLVADEAFRKPLSRLAGRAELDAMEADFKRRAVDAINHLDLDEYFADWIKARGE
jgi:ribosomal protein L16 Arg81 hydroxylase